MKREKYQNCVIALDDGTKGVFTGRAICKPGDKKRIAKIQFTIPKPLPEGLRFEELK